jgi:uncharacterized cupin superfamily protein
MSEKASSPHSGVIRAADRSGEAEKRVQTPFNPNSQIREFNFSESTGLQRAKVTMLRVPKGETVSELHSHHFGEEWIFVLTGKAMLQLDKDEVELRPGDFVGLSAPSVAHKLWNPFDEDVVILSCQERRDFEFLDFPLLNKRLVASPSGVSFFSLATEEKLQL